MWVPSTSPGLVVDYRRALIPLSLLVLLVVWLAVHPAFWVMLLLALVLPAVLTFEWIAVARQRPHFDREFSRALQRREVVALHRLITEAWALRLFGPPGFIDEKRGLIASLEGNWYLADRYLERAYARASPNARKALLPAVLRAKYENGLWDDAETIARQLIDRGPFPGTPQLFLGLILARKEDQRDEAIELLSEAAEHLGGPDKERAERALVELRAGD